LRAASLLVIAALLFILPSATGAPEQQKPKRCLTEATREKLRGISAMALDAAFHAHLMRLFDVWMKDGDYGQPQRVNNGVNKAVDAYAVTEALIKQWSPTLCATSTR
jgi:hypothetical protein